MPLSIVKTSRHQYQIIRNNKIYILYRLYDFQVDLDIDINLFFFAQEVRQLLLLRLVVKTKYLSPIKIYKGHEQTDHKTFRNNIPRIKKNIIQTQT